MAKSFEFKGVPTPDAEFYRYYWGLPVPPEIVEITEEKKVMGKQLV